MGSQSSADASADAKEGHLTVAELERKIKQQPQVIQGIKALLKDHPLDYEATVYKALGILYPQSAAAIENFLEEERPMPGSWGAFAVLLSYNSVDSWEACYRRDLWKRRLAVLKLPSDLDVYFALFKRIAELPIE